MAEDHGRLETLLVNCQRYFESNADPLQCLSEWVTNLEQAITSSEPLPESLLIRVVNTLPQLDMLLYQKKLQSFRLVSFVWKTVNRLLLQLPKSGLSSVNGQLLLQHLCERAICCQGKSPEEDVKIKQFFSSQLEKLLQHPLPERSRAYEQVVRCAIILGSSSVVERLSCDESQLHEELIARLVLLLLVLCDDATLCQAFIAPFRANSSKWKRVLDFIAELVEVKHIDRVCQSLPCPNIELRDIQTVSDVKTTLVLARMREHGPFDLTPTSKVLQHVFATESDRIFRLGLVLQKGLEIDSVTDESMYAFNTTRFAWRIHFPILYQFICQGIFKMTLASIGVFDLVKINLLYFGPVKVFLACSSWQQPLGSFADLCLHSNSDSLSFLLRFYLIRICTILGWAGLANVGYVQFVLANFHQIPRRYAIEVLVANLPAVASPEILVKILIKISQIKNNSCAQLVFLRGLATSCPLLSTKYGYPSLDDTLTKLTCDLGTALDKQDNNNNLQTEYFQVIRRIASKLVVHVDVVKSLLPLPMRQAFCEFLREAHSPVSRNQNPIVWKTIPPTDLRQEEKKSLLEKLKKICCTMSKPELDQWREQITKVIGY